MERLTYRGTPQMTEDGMITPAYSDYPARRIIDKLADYEDKQEQGLLISLPCKVGDTLYQIGKGWYQIGTDITEFTVTAITISKDRIIISVENENQLGFPISAVYLGKRLYLTRSEAEEALEKMGGKE